MVFEILNSILLISLLIITFRISKKINIILIKSKPLSEDIIDCDNFHNYGQNKTEPEKSKQSPSPILSHKLYDIPSNEIVVDMQETK